MLSDEFEVSTFDAEHDACCFTKLLPLYKFVLGKNREIFVEKYVMLI
jgi:hypothetical protein